VRWDAQPTAHAALFATSGDALLPLLAPVESRLDRTDIGFDNQEGDETELVDKELFAIECTPFPAKIAAVWIAPCLDRAPPPTSRTRSVKPRARAPARAPNRRIAAFPPPPHAPWPMMARTSSWCCLCPRSRCTTSLCHPLPPPPPPLHLPVSDSAGAGQPPQA